jgi:hypothetical protein
MSLQAALACITIRLALMQMKSSQSGCVMALVKPTVSIIFSRTRLALIHAIKLI